MSTYPRRSVHRGFTLIELLVVVAIIALLIAILLPSLGKARARAKVVKCQSMLHNMYTGINTYQAEFDGCMLPAICGSTSYNNRWYCQAFLGSTYGKGGAYTGNTFKGATGWLSLAMRCPDTEPCLVDWYRNGEPDNLHVPTQIPISTPTGSEMCGATDIDHNTYTYNENLGNAKVITNPVYPIVPFVKIPKTTLIAVESHGGADKSEFDNTFESVNRLLKAPSGSPSLSAHNGDGRGFTPLVGRPHNNGKDSNMLFMDGQIITDDPYKMGVTSATPTQSDWVVNFRLTRNSPFPYQ